MIILQEIITLLLIGIGLSMDAFSISLSIGTCLNNHKKLLFLAIFIGILHFIMPILGNILGTRIINMLGINPSMILGLLLIIIAIKMLVDLLKNEELIIDFSYYSLIIITFTVSIDSFVTGLGLSAITTNLILGSCIFSVCAGIISFAGLKLGEYSRYVLGNKANYLGVIILFVIGIKSFFA